MSDESIIIPIPQSSSVPVPNKMDRADFVDKIKPEQAVEIIRHKLLGEEWDGSKWVKLPSLQENALTEARAWGICNLMLGAGTINVSISKLKESQINARLRNLVKEAMIQMIRTWRPKYEIKLDGITYTPVANLGELYYVKSILFSNSLAVLSQAGDGSIQELFKTTVQENRQVTTEKKEPGKLRRVLGLG